MRLVRWCHNSLSYFSCLKGSRVLKVGYSCMVGACKGRCSLSGGFLLLEDPRLLLRWAAAC